MTDDTMALRALLKKRSDASVLREMIGFAAARLMELEIRTACGAAHGERTLAPWSLAPTASCSADTMMFEAAVVAVSGGQHGRRSGERHQ